MRSQIPLAPGAVQRLREDHEDLNARCVELHDRASDAAQEQAVWEEFLRDLDAHLAFEEHDVFPAVRSETTDGRELVDRLLGQHAVIRQRAEELALAIRRGTVQPQSIDAFLDALERHTRLEDGEVYPWLEARQPR